MRCSVPGRALAALALLLLPSLADARPREIRERKAPAQRTVATGIVAQVWNAWTHLWGKEGSGLDPDGRASARPATGTTPAGEEGSGLDPNRR